MQFLLVEPCSDNSYHASCLSFSLSDLSLARHIVEFEPSAVGILYDALCSDDLAALIQAVDDFFEFSLGVLVAGLSANLIEYFISVVAVMVMMVVMVMAAAALVIMIVFFVVMIMMMVMMFVLLFIIVIVVMMVMLMFMFVLMSLEFFIGLFSELVEFGVERLVRLHYLKHLDAAKLIPVGRYYLCCLVESPDVLYYLIDLGRSHVLLMRKED